MTTPTAARSVALGLVQMRCTPDPEQNMKKAVEGIREAAGRGAQIVCLQELFRSQYFCQTEDHGCFNLAEPVPGPSTLGREQMAAEQGVVIIASRFENRA
jgi:N-carbamoylputrescine amidase